jgi:hypothetical protein
MTDTVIYQSGTSDALGAGWDVMQVIYKGEGRITNHFLIARDARGAIMRKTDIVLEKWEVISEEELLRALQNCFNDRDKLAAEKAMGSTA